MLGQLTASVWPSSKPVSMASPVDSTASTAGSRHSSLFATAIHRLSSGISTVVNGLPWGHHYRVLRPGPGDSTNTVLWGMFHWTWLTTLCNSTGSLASAANDGPTDGHLDKSKPVTPLRESRSLLGSPWRRPERQISTYCTKPVTVPHEAPGR